MYSTNETFILIPARAGSKGVINKNIRTVAGKPLIAWTIEQALGSVLRERVYVSTDCPHVSSIAAEHGVELIKRPFDLANDQSLMVDVLKHSFDVLNIHQENASVVLLQPTAPLRLADDINLAYSAYCTGHHKSLISVYKVEDGHPARMYALQNNVLVSFDEPLSRLNRQELPTLYHRNGSIYITEYSLIASGRIWDDSPLAYVMPKERSLNIDDEFDLVLVDTLKKSLIDKGKKWLR